MGNNVISVIIPAYNSDKFIGEAIQSALDQTYRNLDIIVVNDGSSDGTESVVRMFGSQIRLYNQLNSGVSVARNLGVKESFGDYVAFLDADDVWFPHKLEIQFNNLNERRWSHTNSLYIGEGHDGTVSRSDLTHQGGGWVFSELVVNNFITTSTILMEKSLFNEMGGFDVSLRSIQDWNLWLSTSRVAELAYQPELLAKYRIHKSSTSRTARKILPSHMKVVENAFKDISPKSLLKKKAKAESYMICSYIAEESKDLIFSLKCAFLSLFYEKGSFTRWKRLLSVIFKFYRSLL